MKKAWIPVALIALGLGYGAWIWLVNAARDERERTVSSALKSLAGAEAEFRGSDRDGNRIQDFWTGDLASLYYLSDPINGGPIALIEKTIADADAKPVRADAPPAVPKAGYYFVALEADDSGRYAEDTRGQPNLGPHYNHARFGFCAYPADYPRGGRWTFLINEGNVIVKLDTGGKPPRSWPADPDLCKGCQQRKHPDRECWKGKID
ncbi:MAG TPA: hypothetical protein VF950_18470 [Planctomycetota bacterium]